MDQRGEYPVGIRERLALELLVCAAPRRSDLVQLGPRHVLGNRLVYKQKKTGAEIDIPLLPQLAAAIDAIPSVVRQEYFLQTQYGAPFTDTGFYNWFTDKARRAGVPGGRSPHGLRKASCRRLAEAGCSPHEIMSISGHATLREVERYTKAANRAKLADSAFATLQNAQRYAVELAKRDSQLANTLTMLASFHYKLLILRRKSKGMAGVTGLEPAASGVTGRRSNRLSYTPAKDRAAK